ncbi:MAG TPA: type II toxin-antitoxin system RelE/ParE family toxin [Coriobacteriia bacterium]
MSSYELRFAPSAQRLPLRLPERVAAAVLEFCDGRLRDDPLRLGKPLRLELAGLRSARVGAYRVIYAVEDEKRLVLVLRIDHRADVYRPR